MGPTAVIIGEKDLAELLKGALDALYFPERRDRNLRAVVSSLQDLLLERGELSCVEKTKMFGRNLRDRRGVAELHFVSLSRNTSS